MLLLISGVLTSSSSSKNFSDIHRRRLSTDSLSVEQLFRHTRGVRGEGEGEAAAASGRRIAVRGVARAGDDARAGVAGTAGGAGVE